jgi:hypothetical protein
MATEQLLARAAAPRMASEVLAYAAPEGLYVLLHGFTIRDSISGQIYPLLPMVSAPFPLYIRAVMLN